jgi:hypothetical protein
MNVFFDVMEKAICGAETKEYLSSRVLSVDSFGG